MFPLTTCRKVLTRFVFCFAAFVVVMATAWADPATPAVNPSATAATDSAEPQVSAEMAKVIDQAKQMTADGKFGEAVGVLNGALAKSQVTADHQTLLDALLSAQFEWGNSLLNHGYAEQALEHYLQSLSAVRELKYRQWEGAVLGNIGNIYYDLGQYDKALDYDQRGLVIAREIKARTDEETFLGNIGIVYEGLGQYDKALDYGQQALAIAREIKDRRGEGRHLGNIGIAYEDLGEYDKALDYDQRGLVISREIKTRRSEEKQLGNIGIVYDNVGQYDKALDYKQQALVIAREIKDRRGEGQHLSGIGLVYEALGEYDKALDYDQQALAIAREIKARSSEELQLGNIGTVYEDLGQYDKALEYDQQALAIAREIKNRNSEEAQLGNIGNIYDDLGQYDKVLDYDQQALAIAREIKDRKGEGQHLSGIGNVYEDLGQYDKALEYDQQGLVIVREIKARSDEQIQLCNIGNVFAKLDQYDKALDYQQQALSVAREIKDRRIEGTTLNNLMNLWDKLSHPRLAAYYGKQAVNVFQSIRQNVRNLDTTAQKSYLQKVQGAYRNLAEILVEQGLFGEAEHVLGMLKEQELLEFVHRDAATVSPTTDTISYDTAQQRLLHKETPFLDAITLVSAKIDALQRKRTRTSAENKQLTNLQGQLAISMKAWKAFVQTLPHDLPELPPSRKPEVDATNGLVHTMLRAMPAGTVVVYAIVEPKYLLLHVITPEGSRVEKYPITEEKLGHLVNDWLAELTRTDEQSGQPIGKPDVDGRELYDIVMGPIAKDLEKAGAATVMWWLDDKLRNMPVAALTDGHKYLVERYRNTVFTNDTLLIQLTSMREQQSVLGLGVSKAYPEFPKLSGVPGEMRYIVKDTDNQDGLIPGTLLMDKYFTAHAMYTGLNKGYPLVHIASHFRLGPNYAMSELLLGDGSTLTLKDLIQREKVFQSVDLLVFSACQTAASLPGINRNEVESLGDIARRKGARSVLASLWPVADESTPVLMEEFYGKLSQQKTRDMALALQEAQLALLHVDGKSPAKYGHPYYWAPFILMGNWR